MVPRRMTYTGPQFRRKATYKGPQDLKSLLNSDEWSPSSLFPPPPLLDKKLFPATPQPYLELIKRLSGNGHPDLRYLHNELKRANGTGDGQLEDAERSRAVVLEFSSKPSTQPTAPRKQLFNDSRDLSNYLSGARKTSCNRLYILEDISTNFVEAFGSHFSVEPSFWARHLRTTNWETSKTAGVVSSLPSIENQETSFSLIYPEERFVDGPEVRKEPFLFASCNLYRKITLIRPGHFYDGVGVVNRRASVWSRTDQDGTWDTLMLVDPPIGSTIYAHDLSSNVMIPIQITHQAPYQGGYIDFIPIKDITEANYCGPPRTSLFDDLIYYHTTRSNSIPSTQTNIDIATFFLKKIIAGLWMNAIGYVGTSVSILEYAVEQSRVHATKPGALGSNPVKASTYGGLEWLEEHLFHIYGWKRRCSQLHDWTEWNVLALNIPLSQLDSLGSNARLPSANLMPSFEVQDWLFIKKRLELYETRSRDVVASALGLLSLVESHKSVEEAESARILAVLGTVYLPLSLTAGVLSMGGAFIPGESQFWIFFAVSVPLMVLSFAATILPNFLPRWFVWVMERLREREWVAAKRVTTF